MSTKTEYTLLRLRSFIADKEMAAANANREIVQFGEWRCDWNAVQTAAQEEIDKILRSLNYSAPETPQ